LGYLVANCVEHQTRAGEAGGIEVVISALRGHPNSAAVLEHAVEALGQLVANNHQENQTLAKSAGGIEAVIIALHQHPDNEVLQKNAVSTLGSLVINNVENQLHAGRTNGIQAVIFALKTHLRCEAVLEEATEALRHLVACNVENQELAREQGAIATAVAVLRRHRKNEGVQIRALLALTELVAGNPLNQEMAGEAGAIKAVQVALNGHPASDLVQEHACESLGHLVAKNQVNQNIAREAGLIETVVHTALEQHPAIVAVQTQASAALAMLVAYNPENQRLAGEVGGVEVVTAGLKRHLESDRVPEHASQALSYLVFNNRENQILARKAGAIEAVILVLRQHAANDAMQMRTLETLRNLVIGNHENTRVGVSAGGIEEVVAALRQSPESEQGGSLRSQTVPSEIMGTVSNKDYQKLAREAGLIEAAIEALKQPRTQQAKAKVILSKINVYPTAKLLTALRDTVAGCFENQRLAALSGAVQVVLDMIRSDIGIEVVQEHAAKTMTALVGENAANQRRAKGANAGEIFEQAQAAHPDSLEVQEAIASALEALRSGETFRDRIMHTEYGRRHSCPVSIADTAMRGVTLGQLLELQDFVQDTLRTHDLVESGHGHDSSSKKRSVTWESLDMYQVRDHFVLPLTRASRSSFVEVVAQNRQPPMWMISHWWGTPFPFTMRMLQLQSRSRHSHDTSSVTYWCCAFANNQNTYDSEVLDEGDILRSPFARAMLSQSCMGTVLLCDTEVTPLLRTWCVFEAHVTQLLRCGKLSDRTDKKRYFLDILAPVVHQDLDQSDNLDLDNVTITMLQDAVGGSWNEVSDTPGVFFPLNIAHLGVGVDVRQAETSLETDKAAILNFLTQGKTSKEAPPVAHPAYRELNEFVHTVFASAELYRVASEQPQDCMEAASKLICMRADVNSFVRQGNTPLFAAAGADPAGNAVTDAAAQRDLVELLLTARADVNRANSCLKTVLDCSQSLSEDARGLLLKHGAKTFVDAAPDLERNANHQLSQILAMGFSSEQQAFVGGDAGTKLTAAAARCLQVVATSILKLYYWAPCRMMIQTGAKRHQAQLAGERARSVMLELESAGCKNNFDVSFGAQRALISLTLTIAKQPLVPAGAEALILPSPDALVIAPPAALLPPASKAGTLTRISPPSVLTGVDPRVSSNAWQPRGPKVLLALRSTPDRLPPVDFRSPGRRPENDALAVRREPDAIGIRDVPTRGISNDGATDVLENSLTSNNSSLCEVGEALRGNPWPNMGSGTDDRSDRPGTRQDKRRPDVSGSRCMAWDSQQASGVGGTATQAGRKLHNSASSSGGFATASTLTAPEGSPQLSERGSMPSESSTPHHGAPADLDTLAGDRWFQTSIRCSLSQPNLHLPSDRPRRQDLQANNPKVGAAPSGTANFFDFERTTQAAPASSGRPGRNRKAATDEIAQSEDGRPPTRCGRRPGRNSVEKHYSLEKCPAGLAGRTSLPVSDTEQPSEMHHPPEDALMSLSRQHSLPLLHGPSRATRTFRVSDLME
jgi:hypothetical protein